VRLRLRYQSDGGIPGITKHGLKFTAEIEYENNPFDQNNG